MIVIKQKLIYNYDKYFRVIFLSFNKSKKNCQKFYNFTILCMILTFWNLCCIIYVRLYLNNVEIGQTLEYSRIKTLK